MADLVRVLATDFNPALENPWDGSPFDPPALQWVVDAVNAGRLRPHSRNCTDYSEWDIETSYGGDTASPGDFIKRNTDGSLEVWKAWKKVIGGNGCGHDV